MPSTFELGRDGPSVVVVGVDGSKSSLHAASFAVGLARRERAHLMCVFVEQLHNATAQQPELAVLSKQVQHDLAAAVKKDLDFAKDHDGIDISIVVRQGDPTREIAKLADEVRADLVIVGRSAKVGHERLGSTGGKLVRAGRWPITIVP